MAELTTLEEKLAEVKGLAQAAQGATEKVEGEATEMMSTYLGEESDGLDGFEFLTMAEAGEVGHRAVLGKLNESDVKDGSLRLAGEKDPYEES